MAMAHRQPLAALILAKKEPPPSKDGEGEDGEEEDGPEHEPDEEEIAACQDVIDAVTKKDPHELSKALHNWMEIAGYSKGDEEEEE